MMPWERVKLGDVCKIQPGGTPKRSVLEYFDGSIPWAKIGDMLQGEIVDTEEKISERAVRESAARVFPAGTVLITIFATIGRTATLGVDAATNQAIAGIIPKDPKQLSPIYLRRYLDSAVADLERQASGVAQVNINSSILKALEIPLPSVAEQRRIAVTLEQVDALRAKRRQAIGLLDALAESVFSEMFGANSSDPLVDLGDISEVQGGLQLSGTRKIKPIQVSYLRVANVYRGSLNLDEVKTLQADQKEIDRTRLMSGDLLIVEGHGNPEEIGRAAMWDGSIETCVHQNHLIRVRVNTQEIIPEYAEVYLNSRSGRRHLLRSANTTSGLNTISTGAVKTTPIRLPSRAQQQVFVDRLKKIQAAAEIHRTHLTTLDDLFASLQHRAFSGTLWDHEAAA